jgi:hypothetical protein
MAVSKPRNRVVLFRLTQDEYNQVQEACASGAARSVSDFARARILGGPTDATSMTQIESRLAELSRTVERLTNVVETAVAPRSGVSSVGGN